MVAAVALGMPATVLQRILLCLNPAISQSVQRVYELALLHEEIEPDAALRLIAIWQASHPAEKKIRSAPHRPSAAILAGRDERAPRGGTAGDAAQGPLGRVTCNRRNGGKRLSDQLQATTVSRKFRPARSSTSTIQMSGSNLIWRAR